ncbi:MAG: leucine--tRNA ligase [Patescibacteria group bacterium]|nr:MAG: leucine--tRNA ligase [Patescibacteria group bacterium]
MFNQNQIEEKWQQIWENNQLFQQSADSTSVKDKLYLLFAFAYPSGSGLHVGHVESKTALDILARYYRMKGKDVFFPVGWDAFGLPAENYAIKTGIHPKVTTKDAIITFRRQIKRIGISYDWANELATNHPEYYKWTQWIFIQMFNKGLAYQKNGMVNWCPQDQTVLANEQVVEGRCERCDSQVVQKELKQWYYKITQYQEELITGLDQVDWPEATKAQQLNWIGKKTGIEITYKIADTDKTVTCFTTRPDTNFGATFVVIAPEHQFAKEVAKNNTTVADYLDAASKKTELDRQQEGKTKTGAFTGFYAINQLTNKKMPIWVSDFVLGGFGTGAVVGVPAHDVRDFEFSQFVNSQSDNKADDAENADSRIEVIRVVVGSDGDTSEITKVEQVQEETGTMINSDFLNGLDIHEATQKIMDYLEEQGMGKRVTTYRLRDWLISRQRYWGTPIPIVYDPEGNPHPVKQEYLPWELPTDVDFKPTGESPLKSSKEFIERTHKYVSQVHADLIAEKGWDSSGEGWTPEFDTMDTFVDSSWYFLRYVDSRNKDVFADVSQLKAWLPVDLYMIGPEHIVLHLLYSRFFTKFLRDEGYLHFDEPFMKMRHQGMILGPDNRKMSKSKGNVINPDEIIEKFGADTLRVYEMFMGPLEADKPWDIRAVIGVYKFLQRVYSMVSEKDLAEFSQQEKTKTEQKLHQLIAKATDDIPKLKFNTSIAFMMEFMNVWQDESKKYSKTLSSEDKIKFIKVLAPFAPFMAEELFEMVTGQTSDSDDYNGVHITVWPEFDPNKAQSDTVMIPVQINGKVRAQLSVSAETASDQQVVLNQAIALPELKKYLEGKEIKKKIYVAGKIISLVV